MSDYKIGEKMVISEDEKYIVVDIVEYENEKYYFCTTTQKPIIPKIFETKSENNENFIREVTDNKIIEYIISKIIS